MHRSDTTTRGARLSGQAACGVAVTVTASVNPSDVDSGDGTVQATGLRA